MTLHVCVYSQALGQVGKVLKVYADGDLRVAFGGQTWTFNPACLSAQPGEVDANLMTAENSSESGSKNSQEVQHHTLMLYDSFFLNFLSCFFFPNHVICSLPHFPAWNQCLFFSFQHRVFLVSLSLFFLSFTCCASSGLFVSWCLVTFWLILTGFELWHVGSSNPFWMQSLILSLSVIQVRSFQSWRSCCLSRRSRIIQDGWLSRQRMGVLLKSANWCKNTLTRSVLHSLKEFSRKKLDFVFRWERISGRFKLFLALSVQRVIAFPFINAQPSRDGLSCLCVFTGNVSL